jgi:hypothetical protein
MRASRAVRTVSATGPFRAVAEPYRVTTRLKVKTASCDISG